jgi:LysR family carnitine catabolism transcriptional activator
VAAHLVPQAIGRFATLYPAVKIEFTELTSAEVEAEVLAGNADFGIGGRTARQGELDLDLIARDPFIALVPHDHPLAGRKSVPLSMLRNYPLIVMRRGSNVRSTLETAFETKGFKLEPTYETTHHYSVVGMVEAGLGVGALPLMTIASLRCDGLAQVRIIKPSIEREIGIVTKHSVALSPAASELIRFVREEIRNADER